LRVVAAHEARKFGVRPQTSARFEDADNREQTQHAVQGPSTYARRHCECLGRRRRFSQVIGNPKLGHDMKTAWQQVAGRDLP
jgi:hypothetical protein